MKKIRLRIKNILSKYFLLNEYCKRCGKMYIIDVNNTASYRILEMTDKKELTKLANDFKQMLDERN